MSNIITLSTELLGESGFLTESIAQSNTPALIFENETVLGFLFSYENPADLIENSTLDSERAIADRRMGLRRAGKKAWNTYTIFLSSESATHIQAVHLSSIEENLTGTRKIARAGIEHIDHLRDALLTLLPIQASPLLDAIDMKIEIRQRATELSAAELDAFLSVADDSVVLQILEETP